jgi:hypothetical protein
MLKGVLDLQEGEARVRLFGGEPPLTLLAERLLVGPLPFALARHLRAPRVPLGPLFLRADLDAMRESIKNLDEAEAEAAQEWLAWAEKHTSQRAPLNRRLEMPADPEPKPEALKPFLNGWSPYGPDHSRWY